MYVIKYICYLTVHVGLHPSVQVLQARSYTISIKELLFFEGGRDFRAGVTLFLSLNWRSPLGLKAEFIAEFALFKAKSQFFLSHF